MEADNFELTKFFLYKGSWLLTKYIGTFGTAANLLAVSLSFSQYNREIIFLGQESDYLNNSLSQ